MCARVCVCACVSVLVEPRGGAAAESPLAGKLHRLLRVYISPVHDFARIYGNTQLPELSHNSPLLQRVKWVSLFHMREPLKRGRFKF